MLKKAAAYIFITAVMAALAVPSAGMLIWGESEPAANELLAGRPALTDEAGGINKNLNNDITDYIADRFAFRQQFITAYNALQAAVFGESASDDVILGKSDGEDHWLYYRETEDDWLARNVMSDAMINNTARTLALMQEYAASQGTRLVFAVAPDKCSVYPEYMPYIGEASGDSKNLDKLVPALRAAGVSYADLSAALLEAAEEADRNGEEPLYHRLDSHWTARGAALGLRVIAESLGIDAYDWFDSDCDYQSVHKGDLYEMLYPAGGRLDIDAVFDKDFSFYYLSTAYDENGAPVYEKTDLMYGDEGAPAEDSISIETVRGDADGTAGTCSGAVLMFRDSFGNALYPFIADTFERASFSRQLPYRLDRLSGGGYRYCIIEIAERRLTELSQKAPVMPAPVRSADIAAAAAGLAYEGDISVKSEASSELEGFVKLEGSCGTADLSDGVYIYTGGSVYEASPAGSQDAENENGKNESRESGSFTAFIPEISFDEADISVILDGKTAVVRP